MKNDPTPQERLLADIAVRNGMLSSAQLDECVAAQRNAPPPRPSLEWLLLSRGFVNEVQLSKLRKAALAGELRQGIGGLPVWDKEKKTNDYYWYYGTYALIHRYEQDSPKSTADWKIWNAAMRKALVEHQSSENDGCARGSWGADDRWGFEGGRIYATALNALTLEVCYRFSTAPVAPGTAQ